MILPLRSQVVVLTGASSGIGRETALLFAKKGATLVLAARDEDALEQVASEIRALGGTASVVPCDVSEKADLERLAEAALSAYGRIDTWINNAGISEYSLIERMSDEEIERIIRVNLLGVIQGCRIAIGIFRNQFNGGTIINTGSVLSHRSVPLQGIYCATKHAVKGFTEALRMEMRKQNLPIRVVLVKPGPIDTPFYTTARSRTGVRPQPPQPVYDPIVVAETMAFAAENPARELYAGGAGWGIEAAQFFAPGLVDNFMVARYFDDQLTDTPDDGRSNLFLSAPTPAESRAGFGGRSFSVGTKLQNTTPRQKTAVAGILLAGLAALIYARRRL